MKNFKIQQFRSPRGCLSYIVNCTETKNAIAIDPSSEIALDEYLSYLKNNTLTHLYILETHTHADHLSSSQEFKEKTGAQILMHEKTHSARKDRGLRDGDEISVGTLTFSVLYTPGHTDDSISLHVDSVVFTGDTLLIGGTGRTDFQNGSSEDLYESLWNKLIPLGDETMVYPGHNYKGESYTTVGKEKESNSRFQMKREEFIAFMNGYHPPKPELFDEAVACNSK